MKRLAIITTHPIQYYAPVFMLLHQRSNIEVKVFYTIGADGGVKYDQGFGKTISWDIPLTEGYPHEWVENVSDKPGSDHFKGIINPGLISQIGLFKPDAVLVFGWAYQSHLEAMRYFYKKKPVYFRGDSTLLDEQSTLKKTGRYMLLKWVYHFVDHAFYVGSNNKAYFKKFGLKDNQLSFAPHAIDNERFAQDRSLEAAELRQHIGVEPDDILILFAGKLEDKKSPGLLLDAFLSLKQENTHLLFTGNGHLEQKLKETASGMLNVHFMDFQNQLRMSVVYQAADLFCLPSGGPGETWGLAVNEAMACSRAVIVSNRVGCAANLVNEQNGGVFNNGDVQELTAKLMELTRDKTRLKKLGIRSKAIISDWNFTNIAIAIENKLLNEAN